jgi:hypothetical protein
VVPLNTDDALVTRIGPGPLAGVGQLRSAAAPQPVPQLGPDGRSLPQQEMNCPTKSPHPPAALPGGHGALAGVPDIDDPLPVALSGPRM